MSRILNRLVALEAEIAYQLPPEPGDVEYRYQKGRIPFLLSAPHGAVHTRNGEPKFEDEYTAAFARLVAEETGAHVLYAHRKSSTDPNADPGAPYKGSLKQIVETARIALVLDIHGAAARRPFGLAIGSMRGHSCAGYRNLILESLRQSGFSEDGVGLDRLDVDRTFAAVGSEAHETITRYAWQRLGVQAVQLELNAHLRIVERKPDASSTDLFRGYPDRILKTVDAFLHLMQALTNR
jgi:hypothetical protein